MNPPRWFWVVVAICLATVSGAAAYALVTNGRGAWVMVEDDKWPILGAFNTKTAVWCRNVIGGRFECDPWGSDSLPAR